MALISKLKASFCRMNVVYYCEDEMAFVYIVYTFVLYIIYIIYIYIYIYLQSICVSQGASQVDCKDMMIHVYKYRYLQHSISQGRTY